MPKDSEMVHPIQTIFRVKYPWCFIIFSNSFVHLSHTNTVFHSAGAGPESTAMQLASNIFGGGENVGKVPRLVDFASEAIVEGKRLGCETGSAPKRC